jgi:adenylate kinase family enzyme
MKYIKTYESYSNTHALKSIQRTLLIEGNQYVDGPIIFVGSAGAGKSTTAEALAKKLGIEHINVDAMMQDERYEQKCKNIKGAKYKVTTDELGRKWAQPGDVNDVYTRCVVQSVLADYANTKVILVIGSGTEESGDILSSLKNVFVFGLPDSPENDKTYIQFLKQSRIDRVKKMGQPDLESDTTDEVIQKSIDIIRKYYEGNTIINPFYEDGKRKTTDDLVDEIIKIQTR